MKNYLPIMIVETKPLKFRCGETRNFTELKLTKSMPNMEWSIKNCKTYGTCDSYTWNIEFLLASFCRASATLEKKTASINFFKINCTQSVQIK